MRILIGAISALCVCACATPTITYEPVGALGNIDGRMVASLPVARIVFTPPDPTAVEDEDDNTQEATAATARPARAGAGGGRNRAAPPAAPAEEEEEDSEAEGGDDFASLLYYPSPHATYLVRPNDNWFSATRIAPTYRADTSVLATLNVETIDRREEFAQDLASVISAFGDPTVLNSGSDAAVPPNSITCQVIEPQFIAWLLSRNANATLDADHPYPARTAGETDVAYRARLAAGSEENEVYSFEGQATQCTIKVSFGPLLADAVTLDYFNTNIRGRQSHVMIGAACRMMSLDYIVPSESGESVQTVRWSRPVPDPNFVRLSPLPYSGALDANSVCAAPSLTQGEGAQASGFHIFRLFLGPFRNGGGDGGTGAADQ
jgi:hypothetical protein